MAFLEEESDDKVAINTKNVDIPLEGILNAEDYSDRHPYVK